MLEYDATDGYLLSGTDPVVLGNGKVSFATGDASDASSAFDVNNCIVTRTMDLSQNKILMDNTVASVQSGRWYVSKAQDTTREITCADVTSAGLDMRTAIHRLECVLSDPDILATLERYAVYHLPYCTAQTMQVRSAAKYDLHLKHYVTLPKNDFRLSDVTFSGNMIAVSALDGSQIKHILLADGRISDSNKPIAVGVMYTIQDPSVTSMIGFQMLSQAGRDAGGVATFQVQANYPGTVHALTCSATGHDFANPRDTVMRCLLSIASSSTMAKIRLDHVSQWSALWKNNIVLEPRYTISQSEMARVQRVRRGIRQSLYILYSSVRVGVSSMLNVSSPSTVDANLIDSSGDIIAGDDMWIIPVLTVLNPALARSILEFRYQELMVASTTASQLGYAGVKYPSSTDEFTAITEYSVAWSSSANSKLYNTALIGVHAWNYYRVTLDQQYLSKAGFPILNGVANFLASRATVSENNANQYDLIGVTDPDGNLVINDFLDIFVCKLALNSAIEACFVLGIPVEDKWTAVKNGLKISFVNDDAGAGIPLPYMHFDQTLDTFRFPSILFPLFPMYFNDLCMAVLGSKQAFNPDMYARSLQFALQCLFDKDSPDFATSLLICGCVCQLCQNVTSLDQSVSVLNSADYSFDFHFDNVLDFVSEVDLTLLSANSCASFLALVMSGFCGAIIKGGIASGKFAYSTLEVGSVSTAVMPKTWEKITIAARNGTVMTTMNRNV